MLRTVTMVIGALGVLVFLLPVSAGVFNVGSVLGIALFALIFVLGAFNKRIKEFIRVLSGKKYGRAIKVFISVCLIFCIILFSAESILIVSSACKKTDNENAVVVVLGCLVRGEEPSRMLRYRIDSAYEYLVGHPEAKCILSGGQGEDEDISEAECMRRSLTAKGISESRIYVEDKSTSTRENLAFVKELAENEGLGNEIVIVTSEFHQYRAKFLASAQGFKCSAVSAHTELPLLPVYFVRELVAIVYEWLLAAI